MYGTNEKLEAMTIAMSEWQRLEHMSMEELEEKREEYKTPYHVGGRFTVSVILGKQGFFDNGKCNELKKYESTAPNCFDNTVLTVYDKDGTSLYTTRSLPLSSSTDVFPIGTILPYVGELNKIPQGWFLCDGNNGTPDLSGRFLEGSTLNPRKFIEEGLPNIEGMFNSEANFGGATGKGKTDGAFYVVEDTSRRHVASGTEGINHNYKFDASRSNPIYGKSEKVQPSAYTVYYIMKIK